MPRPAKNSYPCAIHRLLEVLARPWTMYILWVLATNGPTRFGALRRNLGACFDRNLEQRGFIYRQYQPTIPPAVTYGITQRMQDIGPVLGELNRLAQSWQQEAGARSHNVQAKSAASRAGTRFKLKHRHSP